MRRLYFKESIEFITDIVAHISCILFADRRKRNLNLAQFSVHKRSCAILDVIIKSHWIEISKGSTGLQVRFHSIRNFIFSQYFPLGAH